jgi:hypothetical protein
MRGLNKEQEEEGEGQLHDRDGVEESLMVMVDVCRSEFLKPLTTEKMRSGRATELF